MQSKLVAKEAELASKTLSEEESELVAKTAAISDLHGQW
jgi:hypothetical protein